MGRLGWLWRGFEFSLPVDISRPPSFTVLVAMDARIVNGVYMHLASLCAFPISIFSSLFLVGETLLRAMIRLSGEVCRTTRDGDCLILGNFTGDSDFERGR